MVSAATVVIVVVGRTANCADGVLVEAPVLEEEGASIALGSVVTVFVADRTNILFVRLDACGYL
jgi:hypothetical protein